MKFTTPLPLSHPKNKISINHKILTVGSCFSDNIGDKLVEHKFDVLSNPFGTIFDPLSITRLVTHSIEQSTPNDDTYVFTQGVYKNLALHSSFSGLSIGELSLKINARLASARKFIIAADWVIFTLGTAHVYQYKKTNSYIANCQKLPAANFNKTLVSKDELLTDFQKLITLLKQTNPTLKIILTVSPVRHISDGLAENSLSKSILRQLCHELATNNEAVDYYPSYEIMMDDLRDYRFYKEDMIHPTEQAIDYIWQHFSGSYMDKATSDILKKWQEVKRALAHRPFNPTTAEHQDFLQQTIAKLNLIKDKINVSQEINQISKQIIED